MRLNFLVSRNSSMWTFLQILFVFSWVSLEKYANRGYMGVCMHVYICAKRERNEDETKMQIYFKELAHNCSGLGNEKSTG